MAQAVGVQVPFPAPEPPRRQEKDAKTPNMDRKKLDDLANKIIGIAIDTHKILGSGFTEKIYQEALAYDFL